MEHQDICVSVICLTYNHAAWIRDALEGFVQQNTDFRYEVLVHDDASTDETAQIIREYEKRYPGLVKGIYEEENQYSQNVQIIEEIVMPYVRGRYLALCEGDDYWTDCNKLQKQVDILEAHPEIDICAHKSRILQNGSLAGAFPKCDRERIFSVEEVIFGGGSFVPTASIVCRRSVRDIHYRFSDYMSLDYTWQIQGALHGGMYYLPEAMSVYRRNVGGSWTLRIHDDKAYHIEHLLSDKKMLQLLDADTNGQYHAVIVYRQMLRNAKLQKLIMDLGTDAYQELEQEIARDTGRYTKYLLRDRRVRLIDKIKFGTLLWNKKLFYLVYRIGDWRNHICRKSVS